MTALDNDFSVIDRLRLGIVSGVDATSSGFIDLDLFDWWR